MKIRMGFVSNSSSTSFVLIGKLLGPLSDETVIGKVEKAMEKSPVTCMGNYGDGGQDIFTLNKGIWEIIKANRARLNEGEGELLNFVIGLFESYKCSGYPVEAKELRAKLAGIQGEVQVFYGTADQNSTTCEDDFRNRYLYEEVRE